MLVRVICLIIGYAFGLFQTGYIYGKRNGIDIREHGSGNAGSTNALRTLGKKAGAITLLGDCLKCVFAILTVYLLFGREHSDIMKLLQLYAGAGCVLGHNFPCYLNFHGGKGIAASVGLLLAFDMKLFVICAIVFFAVFFTTHYVSLCSLLAYTVFLISVLILGQGGYYHMSQASLNEMYLVAALLTLLAFVRHRKNIVRLLHGEESKIILSKIKEKK